MNQRDRYLTIFCRVESIKSWVSIGFFLLLTKAAISQSDSLYLSLLDSVEISAPKITKPWNETAQSSYRYNARYRDQQLQLSLKESLINAPSIFASNVHNRAQDLRISIRGFGARSAFGVRGVKLIVDGIPETTADGQGQLDNLNLGIVDRVEVINNGASAFYGNASGGVIQLETLDEKIFAERTSYMELSLGLTAYGGLHPQVTFGKQWKDFSLIAHVDRYSGDGYRDHSAFESNGFQLRAIRKKEQSRLDLILNYTDSPLSQDPGGVDSTTYYETPRAARDRNVEFDAGEEISHGKVSIRYQYFLNATDKLETYVFFANRKFVGRLPFANSGLIDLNRNFAGQGSSFAKKIILKKAVWKFNLGYELQGQFDDRDRFVNDLGVQGDQVFGQEEQFVNAAPYFVNDLSLGNWILNLALRYDYNRIEITDRFLSDGDSSGELQLNDFNYSLALAYKLQSSALLFLNLSTSFETPTLSELSNNPDGSGFNNGLQAQTARHIELGVKGSIAKAGDYQLSTFYIQSENELLPFEIAAFPGRLFYNNTGSTSRRGVELSSSYRLWKVISLNGKAAYQDIRFDEFRIDGQDLADNQIPGVPNYTANLQMAYSINDKLEILLNYNLQGEIFANNQNTISQSSRHIVDLSAKYNLRLYNFRFSPYVGLSNLFNTQYADNLRINAFGGRYFEAAPGRFWYACMRFTLQ
jgi:iron complex outermembrane receptor protein